MSDFQFGVNAICTSENEARFNERRDSIVASVKPATFVESILADELLHASWEMERVRDNGANAAAAPRLDAAYNRASRNWHRSLKQLKSLQSARASHVAQLLETAGRDFAAQCPLADIGKLPKPLHIDTPEAQ